MLVFAADLHLTEAAWKSMPKVCGDAYDSFNQLVAYCETNKPEALILGGDIFDSNFPDPLSVKVFLSGVLRLCNKGIPVLACQGQHGFSRTVSWTSVIDCVTELETLPFFEVGSFVIKGLDHRTPVELEAALKTLDKRVNLLVLHQACKGALGDRDGQQCWNFDPDWVPDHVRLVAMGDIHSYFETHKKSKLGHIIPMAYSGSIAMQSIDEPPAKSFMVVKPDFSFTRIPLKTRPFLSLKLLHVSQFEEKDPVKQKEANDKKVAQAVADIKELPKGALVVVRYDPRIENVEATLLEANPDVHLMFKLLAADTTVNPTLEDFRATTLRECLDQVVDRTTDAVFHSFILELLQTNNVPETLGRYRAQVLEAK